MIYYYIIPFCRQNNKPSHPFAPKYYHPHPHRIHLSPLPHFPQNIKCNNKTTYDMAFLSSSSLMCTAGHSTDQRNISIWDSLMPSKKMLVQCVCVFFFVCLFVFLFLRGCVLVLVFRIYLRADVIVIMFFDVIVTVFV